VVVLAQSDQFAAAPDLDAELGGVLGQQALGGGLRDGEGVRMGCAVSSRSGDWLGDAGEETTDRVRLAEREEPVQQTALVHHLDAARVQAEPADNPGRLRLLQHERVQRYTSRCSAGPAGRSRRSRRPGCRRGCRTPPPASAPVRCVLIAPSAGLRHGILLYERGSETLALPIDRVRSRWRGRAAGPPLAWIP
jgi:hypothetical protein